MEIIPVFQIVSATNLSKNQTAGKQWMRTWTAVIDYLPGGVKVLKKLTMLVFFKILFTFKKKLKNTEPSWF